MSRLETQNLPVAEPVDLCVSEHTTDGARTELHSHWTIYFQAPRPGHVLRVSGHVSPTGSSPELDLCVPSATAVSPPGDDFLRRRTSEARTGTHGTLLGNDALQFLTRFKKAMTDRERFEIDVSTIERVIAGGLLLALLLQTLLRNTGDSAPCWWHDATRLSVLVVLDPWNRMSDEVILTVFAWLPKSTLAKCARVCRRWNRLA